MDADKEAPVFDLFGRKLSQPRKGINIINGHKVIVKWLTDSLGQVPWVLIPIKPCCFGSGAFRWAIRSKRILLLRWNRDNVVVIPYWNGCEIKTNQASNLRESGVKFVRIRPQTKISGLCGKFFRPMQFFFRPARIFFQAYEKSISGKFFSFFREGLFSHHCFCAFLMKCLAISEKMAIFAA